MSDSNKQNPAAVTQVTPEKRITIGDKDYTLRADMGMLKTLQQEFSEDIYDLASSGVLKMRFDQLARMLWVGIGEGTPGLEVLERHIVRERGLDETKYLLMEWLIGAVSTEKDREKNVDRLLKQIDEMRKITAAAKKR